MEHFKMFIDGEFVEAADGKKMEIIDPGTGQAFATVPFGGQVEVDSAVSAARNAFESGEWRDMQPNKRAEIVCELCDAIDSQISRIAMYDSRSNGSPISWVGGGLWVVNNTMRNLAWYATHNFPWEEDIPGTAGSVYGFGAHKIRREPIGVCAAICPWNAPYMMAIGKMAHALVTGNTIVIKPASATPFSALILAELIAESRIPKGVVNVITGPGAELGEKLCTHPEVDKVSLTGSAEVGKRIMSLAGSDLKRITLELGGKSANIVLDDADMEVAVDGAIAANFQNAGQVCVSGSRLLLNRKIYDPFLERLVERIKELETGMGYQLLPDTKMGPISSAKQLETVEQYVQIGKSEGARLVFGGKRPEGEQFKDGYYYLPTIFTDVDNQMRIAQEEIFGPILVAIPFDNDDAAITIANDTRFGLAGAVWSKDIKRARNIADKVRTGTMWINDVMVLSDFAPFGGFKDSGIGKEMGYEGLAGYTQSKMIYISNEGTTNRATFGSVLNYPPPDTFMYHIPTKIWSGPKSIANLHNELRLLDAKRAVIITDKGLRNAGVVEQVEKAAYDRCAGIFDGVEPDPHYESVDEAIDFCRQVGADSLVSVGGGSAIDTAKLALVALTYGGSAIENMGLLRIDKTLLPHIAVPTTHGTGSEVTLGAMITNQKLQKKCILADFKISPNVAILDAELAQGLPKNLTVGTGMDALSHAAESCMSPKSNPLTLASALESIRLIAENLPKVVENSKDIVARQNMMNASTLAGIAISGGLGIAHGFAHTIGAMYHLHHGTACGIGLLLAMRYNRDYALISQVKIAEALGIDTNNRSDIEVADEAYNALVQLMEKVGQPTKLQHLGISKEDLNKNFETILSGTMTDLTNSTNPRPVTDPAAITELLMTLA